MATTLAESGPGRFLTIRQVSNRLSLSVSTTHFYVVTGRIPAVRIGTRWRIPAGRLERWLQNKMNRQGKEVVSA